jgi:hypothetical protein
MTTTPVTLNVEIPADHCDLRRTPGTVEAIEAVTMIYTGAHALMLQCLHEYHLETGPNGQTEPIMWLGRETLIKWGRHEMVIVQHNGKKCFIFEQGLALADQEQIPSGRERHLYQVKPVVKVA